MSVPLDYTDEQSPETTIQILRVPAAKEPRKGSIFVNFGGPGLSGHSELGASAQVMLGVTGGHFDLINVVPRGTNDTLSFSCFPDPLSRGADVTIASNASDVALGQLWAKAKMFSDNCLTLQNETGRMIGTSFTARDLVKVVDELEEDKKIRYWGISYGTILGMNLIGMFTDRIDKIVLDGVVNPFDYYRNHEVEMFSNSDDVFRGFCKGCVEEPSLCPLAGNRTAPELEEFIMDVLEELKYNPLPVSSPHLAGGGYLADYSALKGYMSTQFYNPFFFPGLAQIIADVSVGNTTSLSGAASSSSSGDATPAGVGDESQLGIKCSDTLARAETIEDIMPVIEGRRKISRVLGDAADYPFIRCSRWQLPAKERYEGPWNIDTQNPVLVVGNRYDPVASIVSARNVTNTLHNAVLLEQNGYGHGSGAQASLCTAKAMAAYFNKGELPEPGTVCDVLQPNLFSGDDGWEEALKTLK